MPAPLQRLTPPWCARAAAAIDLCLVNNGGCSVNADCIPIIRTAGAQVVCSCKKGWTGDGYTCAGEQSAQPPALHRCSYLRSPPLPPLLTMQLH